MTRIGGWLFGGAAMASLGLAIAAGAGWARSYWTMDSVGVRRCRMAAGGVNLMCAGALTTRGTVEINIEYGALDPGADRGAGLIEGWRAGHSSVPAGRLLFQSMHARSLMERLGVRFATGHGGFVGGLMSKSATYVVADLPYAGLVAVFLVLPIAWVVVWRRRRVRPGRCRRCGYDLKMNVSGQCPECGLQIHGQSSLPMPPNQNQG